MGTSTNNNTSGLTPNGTGTPQQQALQAIEAQYQQALMYIQAMKNDGQKIQHDESMMAFISIFDGWFGRQEVSKLQAPYKADMDAAKADIKAQGDKLKALDPSFQSLCNTLDSLINCIQTVMNDHSAGFDNIMSDIAALQPAINKVLDAMKQKLQGDMYFAEIESSASDQMTAQQLAALAAEGIQYESAEEATLNTLSSSLSSMISNYQTAYNNANADYNSYNFWDEVASFFGCSDAEENMAEDKAIMANATDMMKGLTAVMNALAPEIAACMPQFTQVMNVIQEVKKEVEKILTDIKMTPAEKQGAILALVMFLLTFFQIVKQDVDTEKVKNNQDMSKGLIESSKINIDNTLTNQKIQEEQERNAKIMQITMIVTEIVLGAVMAAMAPGVGTALLVGMMTALEVLQTSGTWDAIGDLTGAIAGAIGDGETGQIIADSIVGIAEMVVTMGGGAVLDSLMSRLLKTAIETAADSAMEASEQALQKVAAEVISEAGKQGNNAAEIAVDEAIDQMAKKAAEKAAEGAAAQFMKQPFATLVSMGRGFSQALKVTMENAAKDAIQTAIDDSKILTELALNNIKSTDDIVEGVATRAANEAVASVSGKSVEKVADEASTTALGAAASRGAYAYLFSIGNTNMLVDMFKKMGVSDDTGLEVLQVIQQLIQMLAMMLGSGMMSGATIEGVAQGLPRTVNLLQLAPQAVQTASEYGMYETQMKQSKAVTAIAMEGSVADLLHSFIEQLQKDANLEQSIATHDQTQEAQSTLSMAGHLHDGDNAMIQVLISAAG